MSTTPLRERFQVVSSEWDSNGAHHVVIEDTQSAFRTAKTERSARDVARQSVSRPELVQWSRLDRVALNDDLKMTYSFTVSRLERSYR